MKLFMSLNLGILMLIQSQLLFSAGACPNGYKVIKNTKDMLMCTASGSPKQICKGQNFVYLCGERGTQCCSVNKSNPCMAGFYACGKGFWGNNVPSNCCSR